jgi:hypothetical protein
MLAALGALAMPASAADLTGDQTYFGVITAVAPGFYGYIGVELAPGMSCRGSRQVLLMKSNPMYNEILSLLIASQVNQAPVKFARLASNVDTTGYCVIHEASIGNFSPWLT